MEKMEQDVTQENVRECENFVAKDLKILENIEDVATKEQQATHQDSSNYNQNNKHVLHVGIIFVLLTIYLGVTNVQKYIVSCVENASMADQVQQHKKEILDYLQQAEKLENIKILERLLEYKDICKDLEIFTHHHQQQQESYEAEEESDMSNNVELGSGGIENNYGVEHEDDASGSSGNGDCVKGKRNKHKKSKYSIKATNTKNGFNKYNKSTKGKYQKNSKKDVNLNKKNSTAEPIIYLFALVFIYLLLKAASDINQHYKSQNKNDKRLRRCSLQSYAQTHRLDRRASKELALKQKQQQLQQRIKSLSPCSSQDQQTHHNQQQHIIDGLPQNSSELKQQATAGTGIHPKVSYSSNWQLLRQHTTTQSLDNSDILNTPRVNSEISASRMARRCSVPAALSYQRQKFTSTTSPLSTVSDHVNLNVSLSRRPSIVSSLPLPLSMDTNDSLLTETKRRVRMINRH